MDSVAAGSAAAIVAAAAVEAGWHPATYAAPTSLWRGERHTGTRSWPLWLVGGFALLHGIVPGSGLLRVASTRDWGGFMLVMVPFVASLLLPLLLNTDPNKLPAIRRRAARGGWRGRASCSGGARRDAA